MWIWVLIVGSFSLLFFALGQFMQGKTMEFPAVSRVSLVFFFLLLIFAPFMCAAFVFGLLFPREPLQYGFVLRVEKEEI